MIVSGTVAVYATNGIEVAHLHDKNTFGEILFHHYDVSFMEVYLNWNWNNLFKSFNFR